MASIPAPLSPSFRVRASERGAIQDDCGRDVSFSRSSSCTEHTPSCFSRRSFRAGRNSVRKGPDTSSQAAPTPQH
eukprot:CAMPEP_0196756656 /NCGR_PEP_ID=MMETSP1091-20130531/101784_1 /TAXON_ID=302021 /ORGANISM="Rhodomonas sp., Strain CCMP768" /LENGTH=74 /DNA_ID=CAMNT_0042105311 /DNA_START=23 /DNA_END=247 /DNA_ORIENTATION=+